MSTEDAFQDLMEAIVQQSPYDLYQTLQASCPVYKMPSTGFHLVVSDQHVREVLKQPDLFISGVSPMALADGGSVDAEITAIYEQGGWLPLSSCSTTDLPRHRKVRGFLETLFTAERVRSFAPMIDQVSIELLEQLPTHAEVPFIKAFAHPLPMIVIANLLGVPKADIARFKVWSDAIVEPFSMMASRDRRIECAHLVVEMQQYFAALIEQRRLAPGDDFISEALAYRDVDGSGFDMQELMTLITIDLLASGNETTTAAIGSGMLLLLQNSQVVEALSQNPALVPIFVEEILRLESPVQGMFRECTAKTELGQVCLSPGDLLSVRFGAANRDHARYKNPNTLELTRKKPGSHLAFGMGRHVCVGAALARQELLSAFTHLFARYDSFALFEGRPSPTYEPSFFGRNLDEIHIEMTPRVKI